MANKTSGKKGRLAGYLYMMGILPLLVFAGVIVILCYSLFSKALYTQVEKELTEVSRLTEEMFDSAYPGDYKLVSVDGDAIHLYKGDSDITTDNSILDLVKKDTGLELTLFFHDTRILTTLIDKAGVRLVGTGAADQVQMDVLRDGNPTFYHNSKIGSDFYFCFYRPLVNEDGSIVGMLAVCRPRDSIDSTVEKMLLPFGLAALGLIVVITLLLMYFSKNLAGTFDRIHVFLKETSNGNFSAELDPSVIKRNDEIGEMGASILSMQRSMRDVMEKDPLTKLFNRRSADRKLKNIIEKASVNELPFSVGIGDIDHFKRVNDTYGHDAGDVVLVTVADTIREHMRAAGFVARWGGEEFLIVFDKMNRDDAEKSLIELLDKIRALRIHYQEQTIQVTMSFGVTCDTSLGIDQLVKHADERLYFAKEHGRNRVVADLEAAKAEAERLAIAEAARVAAEAAAVETGSAEAVVEAAKAETETVEAEASVAAGKVAEADCTETAAEAEAAAADCTEAAAGAEAAAAAETTETPAP